MTTTIPYPKKRPSLKLPKISGDWTVHTDKGITQQLSESAAWSLFLSSRGGNADLIRGDKVLASIKVRA